MNNPSIGRIVHYTTSIEYPAGSETPLTVEDEAAQPPTIRAAMITALNDDGTVSLSVIHKTVQFAQSVAYAGERVPAGSDEARGKWSWPARA